MTPSRLALFAGFFAASLAPTSSAQFVETDRLVASDGLGGDRFGDSVAVDGAVAVIGAPTTDDADPGTPTCISGAAYVFEHDGGSWIQSQRLVASDQLCRQRFGSAVAVSGDTVVVGASWHDGASSFPATGCDSGAVYVFERTGPGGEWVEQQMLLPSTSECSMEFGAAVAIDGDWLVVGAPRDWHVNVPMPSAFVFRRVGGVWIEDQQLIGSHSGPFDLVGRSVGISGRRVVVGAPHASGPDGGVGVGYVFGRRGGGWVEEGAFEYATVSVSKLGLSADILGDTVALATTSESATKGAATLWRPQGKTWTLLKAALKPNEDDYFATSVTLGRDVMVVGAERADDADPSNSTCNSGAIFVFTRVEGGWVEERLTADTPACTEYFGHAIDLSEDTLFVGCPSATGAADGSGAVYVLERQ